MKKKKKTPKTKGFKWGKWIEATNQIQPLSYRIYGGNLVLEIRLPNRLKLDSFKKLDIRLNKYLVSHSGRWPEQIRCTKAQLNQYKSLFFLPRKSWIGHEAWPTYKGVTLFPYNAKQG